MTLSIVLSILFLSATAVFAIKAEKAGILELDTRLLMVVLLITALVFRLVLGYFSTSYDTDMNLFKAWGKGVNYYGMQQMYVQDELYLDYPPGYLYVLAFLDKIREWFSLDYSGALYTLIVKLPAILADLGCGYLIYRIACGLRPESGNTAFFASAAYLFCPAVIINSTVWGQVDSWCTLILLISLWLLTRASDGSLKFLIPSAALYGLAVITKPQMLIFAPVYLFYTLFRKDIKGLLIGVGSALFVILLVAKPFTQGFDFTWLIDRYKSTMDYYDYYSINAYNLWELLGLNWCKLPESGAGLFILNWFGPALATVLCAMVMFFSRQKYKKAQIIVSAAVLMFTVYIFSVKMHERYIYPALIFILLTYFYTRNRNYLWCFSGLTFAHFLNVAYVLYLNNTWVSPTSWPLLTLSALHVAIYVFFMIEGVRDFMFLKNHEVKADSSSAQKSSAFSAKAGDGVNQLRMSHSLLEMSCEPAARRITRLDVVICLAICIGYGTLAFWNLGSHTTANTSWEPKEGDYVTIKADDDFSKITYLPGIGVSDEGNFYKVNWSFSIEVSNDGTVWESISSLDKETAGAVYEWGVISDETEDISGKRYLRFISLASDNVLNEIGLVSTDGESIVPYTIVDSSTTESEKICDEQSSVPAKKSYYNSTYFDEIYHARTAYEFILGVESYENTHPPLGKLIIALGILIFGMNPFGWRFMGTLFGILMLPILYHLLKRLFGSSWISTIGMLIFTFDFMHFVQTRIATIDTYAVFFLLLMFDAMLVFFQKDIMKSKLKELVLPLAFSGVFMGLGVASKWTCAYAGLGLGIMYFFKLIVSRPKDKKERSAYLNRCINLCLCCIGLFIAVPFVIYFCAFLPLTTQPQNSYDIFGRFCAYQTHMFNYHANLVATHYFASPWYEWPLDIRNIWYVGDDNVYGEGTYSTITCMGNPVVWWLGLASLTASIPAYIIKRKDWSALAIIGYAAVMVPWMLVSRLTFVYHYFTAVPFLIVSICGVLYMLKGINSLSSPLGSSGLLTKLNLLKIISLVVLAAVVALFIIYYPVLSGSSTTTEYIKSLEFMPNWYFG